MSQSNLAPIALVTGGSRGLGKSMALHLAQRGADVILTYRAGDAAARAVAAQIEAAGRKAAVLPLNVGDSRGFGAFAEALRAALDRWQRDRFDYLVNNAGIGIHAPFSETTEDQFDELMNVHLKGPFFLTQKLLPLLADGGRILNVSSGLARFSFPGYSAYAIMKGGVEVLTRYLAKELRRAWHQRQHAGTRRHRNGLRWRRGTRQPSAQPGDCGPDGARASWLARRHRRCRGPAAFAGGPLDQRTARRGIGRNAAVAPAREGESTRPRCSLGRRNYPSTSC